jgi:hypothetical protein
MTCDGVRLPPRSLPSVAESAGGIPRRAYRSLSEGRWRHTTKKLCE